MTAPMKRPGPRKDDRAARPLALRSGALGLAFALAVAACGSPQPPPPPPAGHLPPPPPVVTSTATASASGVPSATASAGPTAPPEPSPISGELPLDLDAKLVTHAVCNDRDCLVPGLYPSGAAADGGAPAAIWSHDLPDKASSLTFPRHSGVDLYGVVLSGKVRVKPLEMSSKGDDLGRWGVFRAPGAGVAVAAVDGPARLVLAVVGDGGPIAETVALLKDRKSFKKVAWSNRPAPIETANLATAQDLSWAKGTSHARIGFEKGRASLGILFASKDAAVPQHQHDTSWEILAPLTADGTAKKATSSGSMELMEIPITDGMVVAMPKATQHAWVPGGKKALLAIQMYVPPGPEQRFKKLSADAAAPPAKAEAGPLAR